MIRGFRSAAPVLVAALAGSTLLLAGCSSGHGTAPAAGSSAGVVSAGPDTIVIKNFMFSPMALTVSPNATVTVTNDDTVAHTITATGSKTFDTGSIGPGKTVTFTAPASTGTYSYICDIHQYMQGDLIVK
jgi:plastocyanin